MNAFWSTWGSGEALPAGWRVVPAAGVGLLLAMAPWTDAAGGMDFAAQVLVFAVLASGQELVTGRGGVVTLAPGLYAVIGGAGVAVANLRLGAGPLATALGTVAALALVVAIDALLSAATWRARRWIFTLASATVAIVVPLLAATLDLLHGGSAIAFDVPRWLASTSATSRARLGYALLAAVSIALWLVMLRIANSPFGRVLPALRLDSPLGESLGYRSALYRWVSSSMAAGVAVLAGASLALWQHASLALVAGSVDIALQVLLIGWVGGFGTFWAAPVGAVIVLAAWRALPAVLLLGAGRVPDVPWLAALLSDPSSQRWVMAALIAVAGWIIGGLMTKAGR